MAIDRRSILLSLLTGAFAPRLAKADGREVYVSCRLDAAGKATVACFDSTGRELFSTVLPSRGHDMAQRPGSPEVVVFARRPGDWAVAVNARTGAVDGSFAAVSNRRFCGHGAFTRDGRLLFATESNEQTGEGVIGIYDAAASYTRVGEFPSYGIGPHDLAVSPDGTELVLANGGLRTDAATGRDVLVDGDAAPNLVRIDWASGRLNGLVELDPRLRKLSIRHLAARSDGTTAFGCQHQGDEDDLPPLVGLVTKSGKVRFLESPEIELSRMKNYVGSVEFNRDGSLVAATSPHGGQVMMWSMQNLKFARSVTKTDVCGIAPAAGGFLASSGNSGIENLEGGRSKPMLLGYVWDNHLLKLST